MGYRKAVILGAFLMTLGHLAMAFEVTADFFLFIGLSFLIIGNGFFKPNISSIVGQLYKTEGKDKDAGYTIFYMGINSGAFLGILLCGYIGENINWHYGFGLAGVGMLAGVVVFWDGIKKGVFGDKGLQPKEYQNKLVYLMSVEKARFRNPVIPDCKLELKIEAIRSHGRVWKYKGEAFVDDKKMADAIWSATIVDRK